MKDLCVGLIGCGTVGAGVLELLHRRSEDLRRLLGRALSVTRIAVRDPDRPRHHLYAFVDPDVFTDHVASIVEDPSIDVIVEVAGGIDGPRDWLVAALENGKDVVTANKATLAVHGSEIFRVARRQGRAVYYEASVAAAIPVIELLQNGLVANQITKVSAILNGTCNYILTRMESEHLSYEVALSQAQQKGFAEADPTLDVSGQDAAHKLALLARLMTRGDVPVDGIYTEGIESISRLDMDFAREFGFCAKLLAIARRIDDGRWDLRVHPTLISREQLLAQVHDQFNAVYLRADAAGPMLIYGNGAGAFPTASSVVSDIVRAAKGDRPAVGGDGSDGGANVALVPIEEVSLRHYIRMTVLDTPGVLGRITSHLGLRGISISSIHQPDAKVGQPVPVVIVTHTTRDREVTEALSELEQVGLLLAPPTRIRIEE